MRNCAVSTGTDNPGRSPKDKPELPVKPTVNEPNNFSSIPDELGLSERHRVFAEYIAEGKALVEAYRLAGYQGEGATAHSNASRMLRNARVSCAVRFLRDQRQRRLSLTENEIIHQLSSIASADPNQLVQYRRLNCRYCWGERHLYFWRDIEEFDKAAEKASEDGKHEPEYGGIGFVGTAYPNPECPKCNGEGEAQLFVADTTQLDGPARWLYAGIKQTQHGTEMRMANQEAARRDLLKLLEAKKSGTGSGIAKRGVTDYSPNDYRNAQTQLGDGLKDLD
ncbi:terminase small subunit [Buttiauxella sp. B2]|nr:terminase small subunit [Buttiauxella sp. B2]